MSSDKAPWGLRPSCAVLCALVVLASVVAFIVAYRLEVNSPGDSPWESPVSELEDALCFIDSVKKDCPDLATELSTRPDDLSEALRQLRLLLERRPDLVNAEDPETGERWFCLVVSRGHTGLLKALLDHGADPNMKILWDDGTDTGTALHHIYYSVEPARLLLERGADVNARDFARWTPLHKAVQAPRPVAVEFCRLLLENGADVNAGDSGGETPLRKAETDPYTRVYPEYGDVIKLLRRHGGTWVPSRRSRPESPAGTPPSSGDADGKNLAPDRTRADD